MTPILAFVTGLTTGGLSCLAVQGGLLAGMIAIQRKQSVVTKVANENPEQKFVGVRSVALFLLSKLLVHVLLGLGLGFLGSQLTLSSSVQLAFQLLAGLFLLATAANLLDMHPIFRHLTLQPPAWLRRRIRLLRTNDSLFAPILLGAMTIFIPCGVTQAMAVSAIALGNPIQSAILMGAFVLGTMPLFATIGMAFSKISAGVTTRILKLAAMLLIIMGLSTINAVLEAIDAPVNGSKIARGWTEFWTPLPLRTTQATLPPVQGNVQKISLEILNNGYRPNRLQIRSGVPVELTLRSNKVYSCALAFTIKSLGIREFLDATDTRVVRFTPEKPGMIPFSCSMGMYTGVIEVI